MVKLGGLREVDKFGRSTAGSRLDVLKGGAVDREADKGKDGLNDADYHKVRAQLDLYTIAFSGELVQNFPRV